MSPAKSRAAGPKPVPPLTSPSRPRKPSSSERTLDNGLRVVVVRKRGVPLVEVRLRVPFLSAKPKHSARATVLSDTVLSGTDRYDRAGLAAAVQALGGDLTAGVDADRLLLSGNAIATNLAPLLAILADVLTAARYPADEITRERARLVERLTIARSRAGVVAAESLARRMYGEHPYARQLPQVADVSTVTRNQVVGLHAELVRPAGAVLVIVGDVSLARALDVVADSLASWDGTGRAERLIGRARCNPPCGWAVSRFDVMPTHIRLCNWRISFSAATSPRDGTRTSARTRGIPTARTAGSNTMCSARRWCSTRMSRPR
jgi:predicted Zn-dependent peptidase